MKYILIILSCLIAGFLICHECNRLPDDKVIVSKSWLDSLNLIAESTPEVISDTIIKTDTLKITQYITQEKIIHVEVGEDTTEVYDTLRSDYFAVFLHDRISGSQIMQRRWNYDVYMPEKLVTEIITQKIPFPYTVEADFPKLYGAINVGNLISADLSYRVNRNFYGIGYGYFNGNNYFYIRYQFAIK